MSGTEPLWASLTIAGLSLTSTVISEYMGWRSHSHPSACRSISEAVYSYGKHFLFPSSSQTPEPEEHELQPVQTTPSWAAPP